MSRQLRLAGYIGVGIVAGLLVAMFAIMLLTRTEWGMERARRFVVRWLEDRVEGELRLGRITGPGLLAGVRIHDFGIIDPRGRPFLSADSLELAYDWRTLLAGRIVLNRVALYRPHVVIERLHGDTIWNFEHVFPRDEIVVPDERSLIVFNDARVFDGHVTIRMPFEDDPADPGRLILEQAPGGLLRTMRFEDVQARLNRVIWESPIEPGQLFEVQSLQTRGFIWTDPFALRAARGTVTARDSVIAFDMPEVRLPTSEAGILGRVVMRTGDNDVDVRVDGRQLRFSDLQWLYPNLPTEGGGSLTLRIQSQPDGMLWLAENARLQAPGTQVAGTVGIVTGDTLYFTHVDLRASPLDVNFLEQLLPGELPVDGLLVGTVEVRGPLSALQTSGDLHFAGSGGGPGADLSWSGVLDVRDARRISARSLRADVRRLELELLSAFSPELALHGTLSGRVAGSGALDRLSFTAALEHATAGGARSSFDGGGTVAGSGRGRRFDVTMNASQVSLQDLAAELPALGSLRGELRGPLHVEGTAENMTFATQLSTPGGELQLKGSVAGEGAARRVVAEARSSAFLLHAFADELPESSVSGAVRVDVVGGSLAELRGTLSVELDSGSVQGLPLGPLVADARFTEGLLEVDSARLQTVAGTVRARGTIGLIEGREGSLEAGFSSESLTPLEEHLFGGTQERGEPRLAGRVDGLGTLRGWLGDLDLEARVHGADLVYGAGSAARGSAELSARFGAGGDFRLVALMDSLRVLAHVAQTARLEVAGTPADMAFAIDAAAGPDQTLTARAGLVRRPDEPAEALIEDLRMGGASPWVLRAPATITLRDGGASVDSLVLERARGGRAVARGRLAHATPGTALPGTLDFGVALTGVPFTEVLAALRSREEGAGTVDARLRITGTALHPLMDAEVTAEGIVYGDVRIDRALAEASYAARGLDVHAEAQYGGRSILTGGGRIPLDLRFAGVGERRLDEPLRLTIAADSMPPALPLGLLDDFTNVGGRIDGVLTIGGTTLDPALSGGFTLHNVAADWDVSGVRYSAVNGTLRLEQDRLLRVDVTAQAADPRARGVRSLAAAAPGGSGTVRGTLDFTALADPLFDLRFTADRAYAARRRDVEATVSGEVRLGGRYSRPEVSGSLRVEQGVLYIDELYRQYLIVGLDDPDLLSIVDTSLVAVRPLIGASASPFVRNLQIRNMQVAVANEAWLRSRDMDVEVSGNLNVTFASTPAPVARRDDRRDEDLRLTGSLNVERGTYTLYYPPLQSRRFQVREGSIEFPGTPGLDPSLAITASYRARSNRDREPIDVLAVVTGTLQSPRVRLTSDAQPPYSESDLASYLFFGVPSWEVGATAGQGASDVRAVAGIGLSTLGPSVLGYASSGLQTLVQGAGLFDYVGLSAAEVGGENALLKSTQLELGRYFWRSSLFIGYSQRLDNLTGDPAVRVEWRFQPEFSLELFGEDRFARTPGFGLRSEVGQKRVYGFSLFREWGF